MKKTLSIVLLMFLTLAVSAKVNSGSNSPEEFTEQKVIAYVDSFSYQLEANTNWSIYNNTTNSIIKSGTGSISNFLFPTPGNYTVVISEVATTNQTECSHPHHPNKIQIQVSSYGMKFNFSTIQFNTEIVGGQSQDNNTVSVDVFFSSHNNQSVEFDSGLLKSAGVGVDIEGKLINDKITLNPGVNHLIYKLSGHATSQTYIMFDFIDINKQVVSFSYPTKIN